MSASPDNAFRIPYPVLTVVVGIILALCSGWAATSVRLGDMQKDIATVTQRIDNHEKKAAEQYAELRAADADMRTMVNDYYARTTAQNASITETVTNLRILIAAKH